MNRAVKVALVVAAGMSLAGCFTVPMLPQQPPTPTTEPVTEVPVPTAEPVEAFVPDEDAFLAAIEPGFVSPLVAASVERETLETGYVVCTAVESGLSHAELVVLAQENLSEPSTFTAAMPELFVSSAESFLCGVSA